MPTLQERRAKQIRRFRGEKPGSPRRKHFKRAIARLDVLIAQHRVKYPRNHLVDRYIAEVNRCIGLHLHYVWGGGHGTPSPVNGPWDCSSFACHCDQTVAQGVDTGTTFSMAQETLDNGLKNGAGVFITHFIKNVPSSDAHVITRIIYRGRTLWTQCGGRDNTQSGDGPCWFHPTPARIREFPIKVHPHGL